MPYETKPMKKQWLEVDGRLTPIILPQIWNHELQDWVVTSEQNPLPTQVYGSNVEVLKSYRNNNQYIGGDFYHRWGENDWITLRLIDPVDVSKHPKRMIYIKNDYDVEFNTIRIAFTDIAERTDRGGVILREVELNESIPAGGELLIDESILPLINQPYSGLMVSNLARPVNTVPTTGTHTIIFLGGV